MCFTEDTGKKSCRPRRAAPEHLQDGSGAAFPRKAPRIPLLPPLRAEKRDLGFGDESDDPTITSRRKHPLPFRRKHPLPKGAPLWRTRTQSLSNTGSPSREPSNSRAAASPTNQRQTRLYTPHQSARALQRSFQSFRGWAPLLEFIRLIIFLYFPKGGEV